MYLGIVLKVGMLDICEPSLRVGFSVGGLQRDVLRWLRAECWGRFRGGGRSGFESLGVWAGVGRRIVR